jgi:DNA helicase II / ATP-dependent DNA helicase PcrA
MAVAFCAPHLHIWGMNLLKQAPCPSSEPTYLSGLNEMQRQAVLTTDGGVLVLAGAGTGKTKALTSRIVHLISSKLAYPSQILAVTFTNKASKEMVHRVQGLLAETAGGNPSEVQGMWLGTFHSIAARILRRDGAAIGLDSNFAILDADDQLRLIKTVMGEMRLDEKRYPPKIMLSMIQSWKDRGLAPKKISTDMLETDYARKAHEIYDLYQRRLAMLNATDFGDLMLHNLTLFQEHPHILEQYAGKFRYILVDEYQDTNVSQYLWLRLLALGHHNICCVGDDDQSIYGWRGAEVGNILKFEQDFKNPAVIRLEQNYRSTEHILGAASALIANNETRHGKTLWTESQGGEKIRMKSVWDDGEEARYVGEEIESLQRAKIPLNHIAILVRAGFQTRAFEERFLTLGVPYRVIGGLRFYERREIRDAVAYLRLVLEPRDDLAFERIINTPKRGIGKTTLEELHATARKWNISLFEATQKTTIKGKAGGTIAAFLKQHATWKEMAVNTPPSELCEYVLEQTGYMEMWRLEKTPEANGRLDNLKELFRALHDFPSVRDFIEHVGLVMEKDDKNADDDMVSLMSLHASKGLEFDSVFCVGWEEGLFPHQRALDESGVTGLEEERRLAYVGMTRAKRLLYITHAANRRIYNQWQTCIPSRFLNEIPEEHVEMVEGGAMRRASAPAMFQHQIEQIFSESSRVSPATNSKVGKRIFHTKFGYGRVMEQSGTHLDILFEKAGRKKLMEDYVTLV